MRCVCVLSVYLCSHWLIGVTVRPGLTKLQELNECVTRVVANRGYSLIGCRINSSVCNLTLTIFLAIFITSYYITRSD